MSDNTGTPKVTWLTLTAMVVGSMVGAGVFSLPRRFAQETGVAGALIAWAIAGTGMLMLAFVFQRLAVRAPDLDAGVYAYAKAGFGEFAGFYAAVGYWASACVGTVTYWVLIMSTLGQWFPGLGAGDTILAVAMSSVFLWLFYFLIRRGVKEAAAINRVVTIAKVIPIVIFVLLAVFLFDPAVFAANWQGDATAGSLFEQVSNTMLVTVFVFMGVEGASVYSRHAQRREDVGKATILGFLSVLAIFASVTIVSYGILPMSAIAKLRQPSMAGVLEAAVGTWGGVFISLGLIVSVLGAYLAWALIAAEVLVVAAKDRDLPAFLARETDRGVPVNALRFSAVFMQLILVLTYFSDDAFDFALDMTAVMTLVPFLAAAFYALKLRLTRQTYQHDSRRTLTVDLVITVVATIYTGFLIYAAGLDLILLSFIFYAPITVLFVMTRREQQRSAFSRRELLVFGVVLLLAALAVVGLLAGWITL